MAFQNPRLFLAHLSCSFTTFSALGSGCISRKFLPWAGRRAYQVESCFSLTTTQHCPPAPLWWHPPRWFPASQKLRELKAEKGGRLVTGWRSQGPLAGAVVSVGRGTESFGCGEKGAKLRKKMHSSFPFTHSLPQRGLPRCRKASLCSKGVETFQRSPKSEALLRWASCSTLALEACP